MRKVLALLAVCACLPLASASNLLFNGDFELGSGAGWNFGTPAYPHGAVGKTNPYGLPLGNFFTYNNGDPPPERQYTSQETTSAFAANTQYDLGAVGTMGSGGGGYTDDAIITLKVGYLTLPGDLNTFVPLGAATTNLKVEFPETIGDNGAWVQLNGASFTTPADLAGQPYAGKNVAVEITITDVTPGLGDDVWFDTIVLEGTLVPEPASVLMLALVALFRRR
jgi:hypothetical protein